MGESNNRVIRYNYLILLYIVKKEITITIRREKLVAQSSISVSRALRKMHLLIENTIRNTSVNVWAQLLHLGIERFQYRSP